jgi:OOP family OmpA-OmpF porin
MKKTILTLLTIVVAATSFAQNELGSLNKKRPTLSVNFFLKDFKTPDLIASSSLSSVLNNKTWATPPAMSPGLSIQYFEGLNDHLDFMASLGGSFLAYPMLGKPKPSNDKFLLEADANLNLKLATDDYFVVPFLSAGAGLSMLGGTYFGAYIPFGGGMQFNLGNSESFLITQMSYRIPVTTRTANYHFNYSLGFGSPLTEKKVTKLIPPPPPPVKVEPKDTDKDGIVDSVDKCPTVPGLAKYQGCPIPDTDKDGINDEQDKCPTVPGLAKYQGCPIPDTDKDGVNDEEDKCPTEAGPASNGGCPLISVEEKKIAQSSSEHVYFATGKAVLLPKSYKALDDIIVLLNQKDNATLGLDIEGHTDNLGTAAFNLKLSQSRANAVSAYFKKKGVDMKRIMAKGYGQTVPVADNKTAEGRSKNRRVELKLKEM